ncbi:MAG: hypothetical protein HN705_10565 [Rhodospirillales bacterium]|jgi:hypothetical protein|nr:hypothetical protein [Rhodospirillales bacterium]
MIETQTKNRSSLRVKETIYCPRDGRRVSVIFDTSIMPFPGHTGVVACPLNVYGDQFDPPLGGGACDQACLSLTR